MRKTKIICTIGPASQNKETLTAMCKAGMNVARMNFSHGTYPEQQAKMDLVKEVRRAAHRHHAGHQRPGVPYPYL